MSAPTHLLDPDDSKPCRDCVLGELRSEMVVALEAAGVKLKYAKEIANDAIIEAWAHMEDEGYETCKTHRED